jgi:hypothetical protein
VPYGIFKLIKSSCWDSTGYCEKHPDLKSAIQEMENYGTNYSDWDEPATYILDIGKFEGSMIKDVPIPYLKNLLPYLRDNDCLKIKIEQFLEKLAV